MAGRLSSFVHYLRTAMLLSIAIGLLSSCEDAAQSRESLVGDSPDKISPGAEIATSAIAPPATATLRPSAPGRTPSPGRIECRVSSVIDGDTIEVTGCADAGRIRLLLIDTPELSKGDCHAVESAKYVHDRLVGRKVDLERDRTDLDLYGRRLRYVWLDGQLFNEELARGGYGKLLAYENVKYKQRIVEAAAEARSHERGVWGACGSGACLGDVRIVSLDKLAEVVTLAGAGDLTGWEVVSARGAATQRFRFPPGFVLNGTVRIVSGAARFVDAPSDLWWTSETVWSNSDDDNAWLYDTAGQLVCEYDDGQ